MVTCTNIMVHIYTSAMHFILMTIYDDVMAIITTGHLINIAVHTVSRAFWTVIHVHMLCVCRTCCYQREEKNVDIFLSSPRDKWVASSYEVGVVLTLGQFDTGVTSVQGSLIYLNQFI